MEKNFVLGTSAIELLVSLFEQSWFKVALNESFNHIKVSK